MIVNISYDAGLLVGWSNRKCYERNKEMSGDQILKGFFSSEEIKFQ